MPTGENTFLSLPPQTEHTVSGASLNFCTFSTGSPHAVQVYWYVGTDPSFTQASQPARAQT
jgi:hypothetical protein